MKFYTHNAFGKHIFVTGTPDKFDMQCNFIIEEQADFLSAIKNEFKSSLNTIHVYYADNTSILLFLDEVRTAADIMATIIRLFEENIQ